LNVILGGCALSLHEVVEISGRVVGFCFMV
jgi:hypothetical protein